MPSVGRLVADHFLIIQFLIVDFCFWFFSHGFSCCPSVQIAWGSRCIVRMQRVMSVYFSEPVCSVYASSCVSSKKSRKFVLSRIQCVARAQIIKICSTRYQHRMSVDFVKIYFASKFSKKLKFNLPRKFEKFKILVLITKFCWFVTLCYLFHLVLPISLSKYLIYINMHAVFKYVINLNQDSDTFFEIYIGLSFFQSRTVILIC